MRLPVLLTDIVDFIYPRLCYVCDSTLPRGIELKCVHCRHELNVSDMYRVRDNEMVQRLWGRIDLEFGASMYRFYKGSKVQSMIHKWKYQGYADIGRFLGREFGEYLLPVETLNDLKGIIPVPLHPSRLKWRGYNQSRTFAQGLSDILEIPVRDDLVIRKKNSMSQTGKGREGRLLDLLNSFSLKNTIPETLRGNHFMLVDDLLTTGATIEAVARPVLEIPDVRLSLATVALGQK